MLYSISSTQLVTIHWKSNFFDIATIFADEEILFLRNKAKLINLNRKSIVS